jgi:hypothetical protein
MNIAPQPSKPSDRVMAANIILGVIPVWLLSIA